MSIKVAIIGVGNCACSLIQVVTEDKKNSLKIGVSHPLLYGYEIKDIDFVAAFDIDCRKVGLDLSQAIFAEPNCTTKYIDVPLLNKEVSAGPIYDGVRDYMTEIYHISEASKNVDIKSVTEELIKSKAEIVLCYLPVGSNEAVEAYAKAALHAGCAFINCMPSQIATNKLWSQCFEQAGLPLLGDDIKSQIGSTAIHRALLTLLQRKGVKIDHSYQLNIGGNSDFMNMRFPAQGLSKKYTKEEALFHLIDSNVQLSVGPSDYVPHLQDKKVGFINIEGKGLLGMQFSLDVKIQVEDSPNSAGVVVNAIRLAKIALDIKDKNGYRKACAALFKNPVIKLDEDEAIKALDSYGISI